MTGGETLKKSAEIRRNPQKHPSKNPKQKPVSNTPSKNPLRVWFLQENRKTEKLLFNVSLINVGLM